MSIESQTFALLWKVTSCSCSASLPQPTLRGNQQCVAFSFPKPLHKVGTQLNNLGNEFILKMFLKLFFFCNHGKIINEEREILTQFAICPAGIPHSCGVRILLSVSFNCIINKTVFIYSDIVYKTIFNLDSLDIG